MKKVISKNKIPIKLWLDDIEDGALKQANNLANLPFAFRHIAIMPDAHQGFGMPIGGVMATENVIVPNAVGVDIGCGMCSVKTSLTEINKDTLKKIMGEIRKVVPTGFNKHQEKQDENLMPKPHKEVQDVKNNVWSHECEIINQEYDNALKSLGTLGGGNHFIEIQKGSDGHIWIMIHSGSRNLGYKVADYYDKLAKKLNEKWFSGVPKEYDLAFLPVDSEEGKAYIKEMNYCIEFALANRKLMMERVIDIFVEVTGLCNNPDHGLIGALSFRDEGRIGCPVCGHDENKRIYFEPMINIAHNYAALENHFGKNVWVHRKGATLAREGTIGIIPGSQGTSSYIVKGLGNPESFMSCSHGAGRTMGRKQAQRELSLDKEKKALDDKGIIHSIRSTGDLDEAPSAYKDINKVMENQKDLVEIITKLEPLAVIKG